MTDKRDLHLSYRKTSVVWISCGALCSTSANRDTSLHQLQPEKVSSLLPRMTRTVRRGMHRSRTRPSCERNMTLRNYSHPVSQLSYVRVSGCCSLRTDVVNAATPCHGCRRQCHGPDASCQLSNPAITRRRPVPLMLISSRSNTLDGLQDVVSGLLQSNDGAHSAGCRLT
jgi:hypothetical protein